MYYSDTTISRSNIYRSEKQQSDFPMDDSSSDYSDKIVLFQSSKENPNAHRAFQATPQQPIPADAQSLNAHHRSMYLMEQFDQLPAELIPLLRDICRELMKHIQNSKPGLLQALTSLCDSKDEASGDPIFRKESIPRGKGSVRPLHKAKHNEKLRKASSFFSSQRPTLDLLAQKLQKVLDRAVSINNKVNNKVKFWDFQEDESQNKMSKAKVYELGNGHELLCEESVALKAFKLDSGTYVDAFHGDIDLELVITYVERMEACLKDAEDWFELVSMRVSELPAIKAQQKVEGKKKGEEEHENPQYRQTSEQKKKGAHCNREVSDDEIKPVPQPTKNVQPTHIKAGKSILKHQAGIPVFSQATSGEKITKEEQGIAPALDAQVEHVKSTEPEAAAAVRDSGFRESSISSPRSILQKITSIGLTGVPLGRKKKHTGKQLIDMHLFSASARDRMEGSGDRRAKGRKTKGTIVKEAIRRDVQEKNTERSLSEAKGRLCKILQEDIDSMKEAIQIKQAELDRLMEIRG